MRLKTLISVLTVTIFYACQQQAEVPDYSTWEIKGGSADGLQYSSLNQINKSNVHQLKVAWTYHCGTADTITNRTQIQCNPIIVGNHLFATSPTLQVFSLDATTGKELWKFTPLDGKNPSLGLNRGVVYWEEGRDKRILYSFKEFLYALNADDGQPIPSFGDNGRVSLKTGLGELAIDKMVMANTPGVIYKDLIIIGSRVHEGPVAAPGYIQAFNVKTGKLEWVFHTIPQPGEFGYDTWPADAWKRVGGANSWSGLTIDYERGMVFAGTGSASFDFYGGNRKGMNLFANCVLALDARNGKRKWHYQLVHHDIWDRDIPTAPILVSLTVEGKKTDAVVQVTKSGHVFVFNRDSGEPIFPIEEKSYPASDLDGEEAWKTQPLPTKPAAFSRQVFTEDMINNLTPEYEKEIREKFLQIKSGGQFVPPSIEGTIIFPGFDGGAEWGGPSFDPETNILYVNANEMPWILTMVDVRLTENSWTGIQLYRANCASCHGLNKEGDGHVYPNLKSVIGKLSRDSLEKLILHGKGTMPAFTHLSKEERSAITTYVLELDQHEANKRATFEPHLDIFYSSTGYNRFLTKDGYPAVKPPWGTLNAIDLNKGEILWQVNLGELPELKAKGIPATGTENYGGLFVTKGGIVVVAATKDEKIRAFDKSTGKILWEYDLPAGGYATPSTYEINGKQYIVIACGGGKMGTKSGDRYVSFALE